jgi:hypothetical protein
MEQNPSWEANWFSASQVIPRIFGTRWFITVPTSARHLSLSWSNSIQSPKPLPISWRSILLLSSYLLLGLPSGFFPLGFPTKTLCTTLSSPIGATCPDHLILLDFTTRTILGKEYRSLSSSLSNFLHFPVTSSLLGPNTIYGTHSVISNLNVLYFYICILRRRVQYPIRMVVFCSFLNFVLDWCVVQVFSELFFRWFQSPLLLLVLH